MSINQQQKNSHLLSRAGFGIFYSDIEKLGKLKTKDAVAALFKNSQSSPEYFDVADNSIKGIFMGVGDLVKMEQLKKNGLDDDTKKKIRQQSREDLKSLNLTWLDAMVNSDAALQEKMSLFWHGHFATRDVNIFFQQKLLHVIRTNALGSFKDLLFGVSKSASMLGFLNNQQNRKQKPNENFAREVMELFTLGRGNYTEKDIKEAARAFTGWGFNLQGEFQFRRFQHDDGPKTFLGKTGKFGGEEILDILLEQPQTAKFICTKLYKFFVNENVDNNHVDWLAKRFYDSSYNINSLMKDMFTADWFYDAKNMGTKIKSPVELLVGIRKLLPMVMEKPEIQLLLQRALGQLLFYPPNVAGWPGGKNWIDSSSLMLRLQIPRLLHDNDEVNIGAKTDDDQQMGMQERFFKKMQNNPIANRFKINAKIDWEAYVSMFKDVKRENLLSSIKQVIISNYVTKISDELIEKNSDKSSREAYIKSVTISLMSTPEFQMG